jgi:hypothetical protein
VKERKRREQQIRERLARGLNDDMVLTREEWRVLNGLSERQARRILNEGDPAERPKITRLSERRDGITVRNNRIWQAARAR